MNHQNAEVVNLYKHTIKNRKVKKHKKVYRAFAVSLILILPLCGLALAKYTDSNYYESIVELYNPTNMPYNGDEIIFTYANKVLGEGEVKFEVPIKDNYEIDENTISFIVTKPSVVASIEKGVVLEVGETLENIKYIKIIHPNNVVSTLENISLSGVVKGQIVNAKSKIATADENTIVKLIIEQNNNPVKDIEIVDNVITWQN